MPLFTDRPEERQNPKSTLDVLYSYYSRDEIGHLVEMLLC